MIVERRLLMGACLAGMLGFKLTSKINNRQSTINPRAPGPAAASLLHVGIHCRLPGLDAGDELELGPATVEIVAGAVDLEIDVALEEVR